MTNYLQGWAGTQEANAMVNKVLMNRSFGATMESVSALCDELGNVGETEGLDPDVGMRLVLVTEELTSNVVRHGFKGSGGSFGLRVETDGREVLLVITDEASAFNPLIHEPPEHMDLPIEDRPIGGLGLHLVRTSADELVYSRVDNQNHTEARFRPRAAE